jgi:pyrimidine-nucleoside phosphorylase
MTNPVESIRKKRDGEALSRPELEELIRGYVRGDVAEYQMSAFLMATYFRGMSEEETLVFTDLMLKSGEVIDLSSVPGRKVDKHSTGGVGDKVSLVLAPMVAACGVPVPMISGRGLGHTGGTLDKLEAIPGFQTRLTLDEYRGVLLDVGAVMVGQTAEIAPADRKMYALRDVTATVECLPLIAGSIMSKKLAEGIDALVLDVKTGDGAFMESEEKAIDLAQKLVAIGTRYGKQTVAFVTEMDQPLGFAVGNWCEVVESVECLRGRKVRDLMEVATVLGGAMVWLGGKASSIDEGMRYCSTAIWSGKAYEKFLQLTARQGGDTAPLRDPALYPRPSYSIDVVSPASGYIASFATRQIGILAIDLGAGRKKIDDGVDPKAGIVLKKKLGDRLEKGEVFAVVMTDNQQAGSHVVAEMQKCVGVSQNHFQPPPRIRRYIDANGVRPWTTPIIH